MLQYGNYSGLPGTYRITLAVSVALLAHTLLMATFPFELPEHNHNPVTVSVQLVSQGSAPSRETSPSQTTPPVRATPFTIEDLAAPQPSRNTQTTSRPQPRAVPEPAREVTPAETAEAENSPQPEPKPTPQRAPQPSAPAAQASTAGAQSAQHEESETEVTLKSETPSEEISYISLLAQTIAQKAKIRRLDDILEKQVLNVEVELNLMSNGALVGARITESSGHDGLDQRVYRAALEASPYPEPPSSDDRQQRFRVPFQYRF